MSEIKKIAVLVSGGGTNLQALMDAEDKGILKSGVRACQQMIAGLEQTEQAHGQRVSTRSNLRAHNGGFGTEQLAEDGLQRVAAYIIIAVAGGRGKMAGRNVMAGEGREYLTGTLQSDMVDLGKLLRTVSFSLHDQLLNIHSYLVNVNKYF